MAASVFDVLSPEKRVELMEHATPNGGSNSFPHLAGC